MMMTGVELAGGRERRGESKKEGERAKEIKTPRVADFIVRFHDKDE